MNDLNPVLAKLQEIINEAPRTKMLIGRGKKSISVSMAEVTDPKSLTVLVNHVIGELTLLKESFGTEEDGE